MPVGSRQIIWSGGEDTFCLAKVGHILDLEEKCKAPIGVIAARLENGAYGLNDIRETIRLALIGGGMSPEKAMDKVVNHVDGNPEGYAHSVLVAYEIMRTVLFGSVPKDDEVGKAKPEADQETGFSTTTDASDDLKS